MITIYHNPRCRKSREGLAIIESTGKPFSIVNYLDEKLNVSELKDIIEKLEIKPIELVRKNEAIWKSDFKGKSLTDTEIVEAMITNPKLIERPIVVNGSKAVVGRPPEMINEII
ncbi:arsenate reductase (glutaredoxin) [Winogradskyella sp. A2]|uniref:arsenate reductase (glutaredoxin) n=1 Tax=Winogradskyella sp. A2 TaxID=3366944 RepID=UPI00398C6B1D